jgi:serine protease Do
MRIGILMAAALSASTAWAGLTPKQIYQKMAPGVVFIAAQEPGANSSNCGTGSILTAQGQVLTNAHVIYDKEQDQVYASVQVFLTGDVSQDLAGPFEAKVLAYDKAMDLALLQLKGVQQPLTALTLGDPDALAPGDETVAIGHPEQGGLWTLTSGVISAQSKDQGGVAGRDTWQMETSLNRGNSGGPLFDPRGYVIGVNTSIARRAADGLAITGINFAIKSSSAHQWLAGQGLLLAYGSLPLDDAAIARAYGLGASPAAAAPAPTAVAAQAPTQEPTVKPTAEAQAPAAAPAGGRAPIKFVEDLEQHNRPYTREQVGAFLQKLMQKRDAAVDELDQSTGGK